MTAAPRPDFRMPHPCSASPTHKRIAPKVRCARERAASAAFADGVGDCRCSSGCCPRATLLSRAQLLRSTPVPLPIRLRRSASVPQCCCPATCPLQSSRAAALLRWLGWLTHSAAGRSEREAQSAAAVTPLAARWVGEPEAGGTPRTCSKAQAVKSRFQLSLFDGRFHATTPCR